MEHQPYTLCADTFNMRLCCSARCPHKKRHRAAINHLVGIRPRLYDKKATGKKTMVSAPKTSISCTCWADGVHISSGRVSAIFPASPTQQTTEYMPPCPCSLCHLRLFCGVQMATYLLPLHRRRGTLRNGYFGNPCSYGSHHGRNVDDNRHCQKKLESVIGRYIHIHQRFRVFSVIPISEVGTNISTRCAPLSIHLKTLPTRCVSKTGKE